MKYLVTDSFRGIRRVDRETECFYMTIELGGRGTYWSRSKKQHGDQVFDTFREAKKALTDELDARLSAAWRIDESDLQEDTVAFVTPGGGFR